MPDSDAPIHGGSEDTAADTERALRSSLDRYRRALRRIHDATSVEDEGRSTSLGYIRQQTRQALAQPVNSRD